jgi:hypothetical protein
MSFDFIQTAAESMPNEEPFFIIHMAPEETYTAMCLGDEDPEEARKQLILELREIAGILEQDVEGTDEE